MSFNSPEQIAVKSAVDALIAAGTSYDIAALEQIYHDDMTVVMINLDGHVNLADKAAFKAMFAAKKADGAAPLNTWAEYNSITVSGTNAHVLITRKVNLMGEDEILVLSIDLVQSADRWQIMREVIFARPDPA